MSFWKYVFDNDHMQRSDIERLNRRSDRQRRMSQRDRDRSRQRIEDLNERVSELEQDLGSLQLINRALLATLREQPSWNEDIFKQTVYDLDLEDGKLDGR